MSKGSLNKVMLIGNIGKDPEIKTTGGGLKIANFSLATSERGKGEKEVTLWHRITAFGKLADIIEQYFMKGAKCYVEGRLQENTWTDKSGNERTQLSIVANQALILSNGGHAQVGKPELTSAATARDEFYDDQIPF